MKAIFKCRRCGKQVGIIPCGLYRKELVDAEAVMDRPDPDGEDYVRIDGSKIRGTPVEYDGDEKGEPAYRMHRKTCGVRE